jgi:hypothetical protein
MHVAMGNSPNWTKPDVDQDLDSIPDPQVVLI